MFSNYIHGWCVMAIFVSFVNAIYTALTQLLLYLPWIPTIDENLLNNIFNNPIIGFVVDENRDGAASTLTMCLIQVLGITIYIGGCLVNGAALNGVANSNEIIGVPGKGKLLNVKSYPPIENYQSGLYEVYQEPYYLVSDDNNLLFPFTINWLNLGHKSTSSCGCAIQRGRRRCERRSRFCSKTSSSWSRFH